MSEVSQVSREALKAMTPEQVVAADKAGRLDALKRGENPLPPVTRDELKTMTEQEFAEANSAGRLEDVLTELYGSPNGPGSADMGARGVENLGGQLTQADLKLMSPDAVVKAHREGRCDTLLGIVR
jgi:hypothetical protein